MYPIVSMPQWKKCFKIYMIKVKLQIQYILQ